jgi:hypothetical protein
MMKTVTGTLLALALAGCSHQYAISAPTNFDQSRMDRDSAGCRNTAQAIGQSAHSWVRDQRREDIFRDCMIEKGYTASR